MSRGGWVGEELVHDVAIVWLGALVATLAFAGMEAGQQGSDYCGRRMALGPVAVGYHFAQQPACWRGLLGKLLWAGRSGLSVPQAPYASAEVGHTRQ
jgi:hypothetical protein